MILAGEHLAANGLAGCARRSITTLLVTLVFTTVTHSRALALTSELRVTWHLFLLATAPTSLCYHLTTRVT